MEAVENGPKNHDNRNGGIIDGPTNPMVTPLLTDLYQFTMAYAYWKAGKHNERAVFDLFYRKNPFGGEYTVFAGLEDCIRFVAHFNFTEDEIAFVRATLPSSCEDGFYDYLRGIDCSDIEIYAISEGSVVFPKVPLMRIEGPIAVVQLLETPFVNLINFASLVATNAARHRFVAGKSKLLLEFGLRRAQNRSNIYTEAMEPPHQPPSSIALDPLLPVPTATTKLRLMCSYGGHIVPRPQCKSLFYAGGDTRIVALDRRTSASSLASLTSHLSRTLFNNRPFHLKYQLPDEDLDSLISVTNDEDLENMLEEHDRISAVASLTPSRIRLFIFPVKPESLGSVLIDPKTDSWLSDALKNTRIVQRGQSADAAALGQELMGLDIMGRSDCNAAALEYQAESSSNSGGNGGEAKEIGVPVPESLVLEINSSFGSTSSSASMSNLPAVGVYCEDGGVSLFEKKIRVPSSASLESDNSVGSAGIQPKAGIYQEAPIQVASGVSSYIVETENSASDPQSIIHLRKKVQLAEYQLPQQSDGKHHQYEVQYVQGDPCYMPQYPTAAPPLPSYYPLHQMPMHQQLHSPYTLNQPQPIHLAPVRSNQNYGISKKSGLMDNTNVAPIRSPLHPQATLVPPPITYKEAITGRSMPEAASKVYHCVPGATPVVIAPITQGKQLFMELPKLQHPSQPVITAPMAISDYVNEFDDDVAYTQIYKTQPLAPSLPFSTKLR